MKGCICVRESKHYICTTVCAHKTKTTHIHMLSYKTACEYILDYLQSEIQYEVVSERLNRVKQTHGGRQQPVITERLKGRSP